MKYKATLKKRAIKDLADIPKQDQTRILERIQALQNELKGDVKKLTNHTTEYRMRTGNWRVLFELEGETIVIYRILHRKDAYS